MSSLSPSSSLPHSKTTARDKLVDEIHGHQLLLDHWVHNMNTYQEFVDQLSANDEGLKLAYERRIRKLEQNIQNEDLKRQRFYPPPPRLLSFFSFISFNLFIFHQQNQKEKM